MVNLLFVIGIIDILYLVHKIPNLFINRPIIKFITKITAGVILMHLLLKAYVIITFKDTCYLEIKAIILIILYAIYDLVMNLKYYKRWIGGNKE